MKYIYPAITAMLTLCVPPSWAFKMGYKEQYTAIEQTVENKGGNAEYQRIQGVGSKFGDPIHEDMTIASLRLSLQHSENLLCKVSKGEIEEFTKKSERARLGNSICCAKTAKSLWCDRIPDIVRFSDFDDPLPPLISGTRWPDDACHMSSRPDTSLAWAAWMVDPAYRRASNINYSSHFHNKQFLHSMMSVGFRHNNSGREGIEVTQHKLITWAEFAFKVANGSIPTFTPLSKVPTYLEPHRDTAFRLGFGGYGATSIGRLFAGTSNYDPAHVRQIALGALLHTIQDSFSLSHASRENSSETLLKKRGKITGFYNYRMQVPSEHGVADQRPMDAVVADVDDSHPVSYGAQLIGCAASVDDPDKNWSKIKLFLTGQVFAIVK